MRMCSILAHGQDVSESRRVVAIAPLLLLPCVGCMQELGRDPSGCVHQATLTKIVSSHNHCRYFHQI